MDTISYSRPDGCRDYDERATAKRKDLEKTLLDLFERYGYGLITVPTLEYSDLYSPQSIGSDLFYRLLGAPISEPAVFPAAESEMLEGAPRQGRHLSEVTLRPEFTAPVARWFVSRLISGDGTGHLPARLAYAGQVFRNTDPTTERLKEFRQIGVELIGSDRRRGDLEILCLACDAASELGLPDWQLQMGHARLYREILRSYGLDGEVLVGTANNIGIAARMALRSDADDETFLNYVRIFLRIHRSRFPASHPGVENPDRLSAAEWRVELPELHDAYLRHLWAGPQVGLSPEAIADLLDLARLSGDFEAFFSRFDRFRRSDEIERQAAELRWLCEELRREKGVTAVLTAGASRNLAYYTGLTFEVHCPIGLSPYTSVCGGGRYDGLHRWIYRRILETQELRRRPLAPRDAAIEQALNGVGLAFSVESLTGALAEKE